MSRVRSPYSAILPIALFTLLPGGCMPGNPTTGTGTTAVASGSHDGPRLTIGGRTLRVLLAETLEEQAHWPQQWSEVASGLPTATCIVLEQAGMDDASGRITAKGLPYGLDALYVRDGRIIAIARNLTPCPAGFAKQDTATVVPRTADAVEPRMADPVGSRTALPAASPVSAAPVLARNVDDLLVETDGGCPSYRLMGSVDYLVELPAGTAEAWGLKAGDALTPIPAKARVGAGAVGTWDLQIPGVAYSTGAGSGAQTVIAPGAGLGRLSIAGDGSYSWTVNGTTVRDQLKAIAPRRFSSRWHESWAINDGRETFYFDRIPTWLAAFRAEDPKSDTAVAKGTRAGT